MNVSALLFFFFKTSVNRLMADYSVFLQKTKKTPMVVANPREVPEYELNPLELQIRKGSGISKA